ncbi:hypothetical protein Dsin_009035 [Dipteronia sinensis]|uniref:Calcium-transporting P-type ATPase N-terminal autoinhibitory domain-containing protein n=1 Tax=Dipteronia sinensis TaxID=43782 RepID=A0AAE0ED39_9ROSI|nr:hypothetical protein Dsin_009035 [Dipteronia sinensis]
MMESYLNENFGVQPKDTSEEVLERCRKLCGAVKNPKRRFRFTTNLSKRYKDTAMSRSNQINETNFEFLKNFELPSVA